VGGFHGMKLSKDGTWQTVILKGFKGVKNLWVNLISGPKCIDEGWTIGNEGRVMTLSRVQLLSDLTSSFHQVTASFQQLR
jgi:hypothetical protein